MFFRSKFFHRVKPLNIDNSVEFLVKKFIKQNCDTLFRKKKCMTILNCGIFKTNLADFLLQNVNLIGNAQNKTVHFNSMFQF